MNGFDLRRLHMGCGEPLAHVYQRTEFRDGYEAGKTGVSRPVSVEGRPQPVQPTELTAEARRAS